MKSFFIGSTSAAVPTTGTNFAPLSQGGSSSWTTTEQLRAQIVPHAMTLDQLRVRVTTAPGAGTSWVFTLMVNGVASALTATISDTNTTASDATHTISLAAGDRISLQVTVTGTPGASGISYWSVRQDSTSGFAISGVNIAIPTAPTGSSWQPLQGRQVIASTNVLANQIIPAAGVIKNLYLQFRFAPGGTNTFTVTLYKNGVATSLAVSVTGTATTGNNTTDTVTIAAGDKIALAYSGASASSALMHAVTFAPTTDGDSFIMNNASGVSPSTSALNYQQLTDGAVAWSATETAKMMYMPATTIKALFLETSVSPGVSPKAYIVKARLAQADTTASVTVNDASAAGTGTGDGSTRNASVTGLSVTVADDSQLDIQSNPNATTPGTVFIKTSLLFNTAVAAGTAYTQALTASLTFVGVQAKLGSKALSASLSLTGAVSRFVSRTLTSSQTFIGGVTRTTRRILASANLNFAGSLTPSHLFTVALTASLNFIGGVAKSTQHRMAASRSFIGVFNKSVKRSLTASQTFVGLLNKRAIRQLTGAQSFVGAFNASHLIIVAFTASVSFIGSQVKRTSRSLAASQSFIGSLPKRAIKAFTGTLSLTGAFTKKIVKSLTASLSITGSLITFLNHIIGNHYNQAFTANLTLTGSFGRAMFKPFTASLSLLGNLNRRITHSFTAGLSFIGSFATKYSVHWQFLRSIVSSRSTNATESTSTTASKLSSNATIETMSSGSNQKTVSGQPSNSKTIESNTNEVTL